MRVIGLEVGPFLARCVILAPDTGSSAVVVDPGFDAEVVIERLRDEDLTPTTVVLTHAHIDHAYGVADIRAAFADVQVLLHRDDEPLLEHLASQAEAFGFPAPPAVRPDGFVADGETVAVGPESLVVRHTPGHSPGHIVLVGRDLAPPLAVVGDVLFAGSIGRTDLWGGSYETLERSIRTVLYTLPGETRVVPGHGPETTIAAEMASNPFVAGS